MQKLKQAHFSQKPPFGWAETSAAKFLLQTNTMNFKSNPLILILLTLLFSSCDALDQTTTLFIIEDGGDAKRQCIHLDRSHSTMQAFVLENTLDDTAKLGGSLVIPPRQTGNLYRTDCFVDSMIVHYDPYKAHRGRLVIKYTSKKY